jgi:hypothetical protein
MFTLVENYLNVGLEVLVVGALVVALLARVGHALLATVLDGLVHVLKPGANFIKQSWKHFFRAI